MLKNVRITGTSLGPEDHGIFTAFIFFEGSGCGGGFGGYVLGPHAESWLRSVMRCAGVDRWEDVTGKLIRVDDPGLGKRFTRIAHIIDEDVYFDAVEWSASISRDQETET